LIHAQALHPQNFTSPYWALLLLQQYNRFFCLLRLSVFFFHFDDGFIAFIEKEHALRKLRVTEEQIAYAMKWAVK
jgi:hypothetical protein